MHPLSRCRILVPLLVVLLCGPLLALAPAHTRAATNRWVASAADGPMVQTGCTSILNFCSLREALAAAADGDTIHFHPQVTGTIMLDLTQGALSVTHSVTIQGPGAAVLAVDGGANAGKGSAVPVFVAHYVQLTISGLTIQNGFNSTTRFEEEGGGIAGFGATVVLTGCVVQGNQAFGDGGGGIFAADVTLMDTTVSDNTASYAGGGIAAVSIGGFRGRATLTRTLLRRNTSTMGGGLFAGMTTIVDSTIADNTAISWGGGLDVNIATITGTTLTGNRATGGGGGAINLTPSNVTTIIASTITGNTAGGGIQSTGTAEKLTLAGTIVAGNRVSDGASAVDVYGAWTSKGYNLIGNGTGGTITPGANTGTDQVGTAAAPLDARFDPRGLQDNGGPTPTVALLPNSPAIDAGGPCATDATDQRGQPRVGNCDIGAYEYQPVSPTVADMTVGASGGLVTFQGTGFQTGSKLTVGATTVTATAAAVNADGTQLRLTIPAHAAGAVPFTITNPGGQHTMGTLTYTTPSPLPPSVPTGTGSTGSTGNPAAQPGPRPAKASPASGAPNPLPTGR